MPESTTSLTAWFSWSWSAGRPARRYLLPFALLYARSNFRAGRPDLGINSSVNQDDPSNLIQVILYGVTSHQGTKGVVMPGFAQALSDDQVAQIAAYLRADRAQKPAWENLREEVTELRARGPGSH